MKDPEDRLSPDRDAPLPPSHKTLRARLLPHALAGVLRRRPQRDPEPTPPTLPDTLPFDGDFYLADNPDVASAGIDPRQHFVQHGLAESRDPHPLVDIAHLRSQIEDDRLDLERVAGLLEDPSVTPHPRFDPAYYLAQNPDVAAAGWPPLRHYIEHGAEEGRSPSPEFDADRYLLQHPEAGTNRYQAFVHYARVGASHDLSAAPVESGLDIVEPAVRSGAAGVQGVGVLDGVDHLVARGWAYAPDQPGVVVEVMDGERVVGRGTASEFRRDLEGQGYGDAHCGFSIPLSRHVADGRGHRLQARFAGGTPLHGEVDFLLPPPGDLPFDPVPPDVLSGAAEQVSASWDVERRHGFGAAIEEAALLLESGQHDAASGILQEMDARYPPNPLVALLLALSQLGLGRADLALASARAARDDAALAPWAWLAVGQASRALGHWTEAGEAFRRASALAPRLRIAVARLEEVEERAAVIEARRRLAAGDTAAALHALVPGLLKHPHSSSLQELVLKASNPPPDGEVQADVQDRKAIRSITLLGAVVDHLRNRGTAG